MSAAAASSHAPVSWYPCTCACDIPNPVLPSSLRGFPHPITATRYLSAMRLLSGRVFRYRGTQIEQINTEEQTGLSVGVSEGKVLLYSVPTVSHLVPSVSPCVKTSC